MPSSRRGCLSPPPSLEHSRCFDKDTKGADGAADLLEVLRDSPLEKLDFRRCSQIPSAAWQKLRGASWTNLREANFYSCLVLQMLRCLNSSLDTALFFFRMLRAIVTAVSLTTFDNIERQKLWSRQLQMVGLAKVACKRSGNRLPSFYPHHPFLSIGGLGLRWHKRTFFDMPSSRRGWYIPLRPLFFFFFFFEHSRCFSRDTSADGAADLLEVLSKSPLEKLNFDLCHQIPSTAWQRVPSGAWPALRDAYGIPKEEVHRIRGGHV